MSEPTFDSSRKALAFALNYRLDIARPLMSRLVADGSVRRLELADGSHVTVASKTRRQAARTEGLRGLDGAATAGMILRHLVALPDHQQLVLTAEMMKPRLACSCRAPCCSGFRPNPPWARAVRALCDHLREEARLSKRPGKRGLGTSPLLRESLVERFFAPSRDELSLARLASEVGVSEQTVANHKKAIVEYLESLQQGAWSKMDHALAKAGIVGSLTE